MENDVIPNLTYFILEKLKVLDPLEGVGPQSDPREMVGYLNNAHLYWDLSYTKNTKVMVETKAIYISKVSNHINVNMDRYKKMFFL